jgi:hypothetical protein
MLVHANFIRTAFSPKNSVRLIGISPDCPNLHFLIIMLVNSFYQVCFCMCSVNVKNIFLESNKEQHLIGKQL